MIYLFIGIFTLWIIYSGFEGYREALYYDMAYKQSIIPELHPNFVIQRSCIILIISGPSFFITGIISILFIISIVLVFSFIHDTYYYNTRNNLNPLVYPERWRSESTTSTAKFELGLLTRVILLIVGLISLIAFMILSRSYS